MSQGQPNSKKHKAPTMAGKPKLEIQDTTTNHQNIQSRIQKLKHGNTYTKQTLSIEVQIRNRVQIIKNHTNHRNEMMSRSLPKLSSEGNQRQKGLRSVVVRVNVECNNKMCDETNNSEDRDRILRELWQRIR